MTKVTGTTRKRGATDIFIVLTILLLPSVQVTCKPLQTIQQGFLQPHYTPHHKEQPPSSSSIRKRNGEAQGHYDRGVPEHFVMSEHGPEIHLDIDEHGTSVDTHPAALSMDTATDPHEHCCHHNYCEHTCHCCCGHHSTCTGGKRGFKENLHLHHHHHHQRLPGGISNRVRMSNMIEQSPMTRRYRHPGHCYGGVCRDRIEEFRIHGPEPYEFIGHPEVRHPHDEIPAQIMYTTDERLTTNPLLNKHLNGLGRITHDSSVDHKSIENYCYRGVCENSASDNHVQVPAFQYQQSISVPAQATYSPVAERTMLDVPQTNLPHRPLYKMEEVSHVIASDSELQKGVEKGQQTHKPLLDETKVKVESMLGTNFVVGHHHKSLKNLTEEYRPEPEEHVTGRTRGTIEKYISIHENQLHTNPLASAEKEEGRIISFDTTSGGLAKKDGRIPEKYGVLDVNPDELKLKRSMVGTSNLKIKKWIVTEDS